MAAEAPRPSLADLAGEPYCYLTTTGRVTRRPREVEMWFGVSGDTIYLLSGGRERSHWVGNALSRPEVTVRIAGHAFAGRARRVDEHEPEDAMARRLLVAKYQPTYDGDLTEWGETALPIAIDVAGPQAAPEPDPRPGRGAEPLC